jgi:hypothetical protein
VNSDSGKSKSGQAPEARTHTPRMLRLVIVCLLVWVVCALLTWFAGSYLENCCDMSMFSRIFK